MTSKSVAGDVSISSVSQMRTSVKLLWNIIDFCSKFWIYYVAFEGTGVTPVRSTVGQPFSPGAARQVEMLAAIAVIGPERETRFRDRPQRISLGRIARLAPADAQPRAHRQLKP